MKYIGLNLSRIKVLWTWTQMWHARIYYTCRYTKCMYTR